MIVIDAVINAVVGSQIARLLQTVDDTIVDFSNLLPAFAKGTVGKATAASILFLLSVRRLYYKKVSLFIHQTGNSLLIFLIS